MNTRDRLLYAVAIAATMSWMPGTATATGSSVNCTPCSAAELERKECANFNGNVIKFLGATPVPQCVLSNGQTAPCTSYRYQYCGGALNQVNVAIPKRLTQTLNEATEINCSQYVADGKGDPTTGFGKNQLTLGICRVAYNLAPGAITTEFAIKVDPSSFDAANPLDWQLKQGNKVYAASILGPFSLQPTILESAVTLTTPTGETVSYTNAGGNITVTGGTGADVRAVPLSGTKLCIVNPNADPGIFPGNWTCETISYATDQCDIKTTGTDPCRFIGGTCIKY